MTSFYPGPSRVYDQLPKWVKNAHKKGVLSMSHRSKEFMALARKTDNLLKKNLEIPPDYTVLFLSSATECWEVIAQSLVRSKSLHIHNGAFGQKWFEYTRRLNPLAESIPFEVDEELTARSYPDGDVICVTQNETSNGTEVSNKIIAAIGKSNPDHLIAVDATSSMAGIRLDFSDADVWFASVQKCFGLPAGLAVMICSPRAILRVNELAEKSHYNSLQFMKEMMDKWQTSFTPNVLGIYLLKCAIRHAGRIRQSDKKITRRQKDWIKFFKGSKVLQLYISNAVVRSRTVITVKGNEQLISKVKAYALKRGFVLGEGYGHLNRETFRIANFPALRQREINSLIEFLRDYR
jgi:phosphoserine aminotransferase